MHDTQGAARCESLDLREGLLGGRYQHSHRVLVLNRPDGGHPVVRGLGMDEGQSHDPDPPPSSAAAVLG